MTNKYNRNLKLLTIIQALHNSPMYFFSPLYYLQLTNSYFLISVLYVIGHFTKLIMEVPTGVISDKYLGRKGTYIAGITFKLLGFIGLALGTINLVYLFIGRFLFGIGLAFESGNTNALLYDSVEKADTKKDYHYYYGKFRGYNYFSWGLGILICGIISIYYSLVYVVLFCALQQLIKIILGIFLIEPSDGKEIHKQTKNLKFTFEAIKMFKGKPKLKLLSILSILRKGLFFAPDKFCTVFYKLYFSYFQIGLLVSASLFLCSFLARKTNKISNKLGLEKTLLACELYSIPIHTIAYGIPTPLSPILVELANTSNAIEQTCEGSLLQSEYDNKYRATMDSLREIIGALFLSIMGMIIGYLADIITLEKTLLLITFIRILILPLYIKLNNFYKPQRSLV